MAVQALYDPVSMATLAYLVIAGVDKDFADELSKSQWLYCWQRQHIFSTTLNHKSVNFSGVQAS